MIILVDFDNTMVYDKFPEIGNPVPGSIETLKWLNEKGVKIILYTMRSHSQFFHPVLKKLLKNPGQRKSILDDAIEWCKNNGIKLWAVNDNPEQTSWTNSRKIHGDYVIDDRSLGIPKNLDGSVNWFEIRKLLEKIV